MPQIKPVHDQITAKYYSQLQEGLQGFYHIRMTRCTTYQVGQEDDLQVGRIHSGTPNSIDCEGQDTAETPVWPCL